MSEVDNTSRILYHYLRALHVKVSKMTVRQLLDNPLGNSMRGISDALDALHIRNEVYQLPKEYLNELKCPCIAVTADNNAPYCLIEKIEKETITITIHNTRHKSVSKRQFLQKWTGGVLMAELTENTIREKYCMLRNIVEWIRQYQLLLAVFITILFILFGISNNYSAGMILYLLTLCIGILVSSAIIYKETVNSRFLHRFCHIGRVIDCDEVLHSKGAQIMGIGLGELSLFYFSNLLLFALACPHDFYFISGICNIFAVAFTIYSILYQAFVVHKGCMLCMIANITVWSSSMVLILFQKQFYKEISLIAILSLMAIACITLIGWLEIKTLLKAHAEGKQLKIRFSYLMEPVRFQKLLSVEAQIGEMVDKEIALHNQVSSERQLMIVTNPNCRNCAKMHSYIKEIASHISVSLILLTFPKDEVGEHVAKAIIATYRTEGWEKALMALEEWYKTHKQNELDKYAITIEEQRIWKQQQNYCSRQHISRTPSLIIDRYFVPECYQAKELKYVLA